jgi:hypothetical protein
MIKSCCYIPVNVSYVITVLILPDLAESHSSPFKGRMILSCEDLVGQIPGF